MDLDQIDDILLLLAAREQQQKRRVQTGQPGQEYIRELLDSGHPARIFHLLRMQLATFYTLRDWLAINTDLKGSNVRSNQRVRGWGERGINRREAYNLYSYNFKGCFYSGYCREIFKI